MLQLINTIICDDIRIEAGNKFSYMGIYQTDLFIPSVPWFTSKVCFIQSIRIDAGDYKITQTITGPTQQVAKLDFIENGKVFDSSLPFVIRSVYGPLQIVEFGEYRLELYINGELKPELTHKFKFLPNN